MIFIGIIFSTIKIAKTNLIYTSYLWRWLSMAGLLNVGRWDRFWNIWLCEMILTRLLFKFNQDGICPFVTINTERTHGANFSRDRSEYLSSSWSANLFEDISSQSTEDTWLLSMKSLTGCSNWVSLENKDNLLRFFATRSTTSFLVEINETMVTFCS